MNEEQNGTNVEQQNIDEKTNSQEKVEKDTNKVEKDTDKVTNQDNVFQNEKADKKQKVVIQENQDGVRVYAFENKVVDKKKKLRRNLIIFAIIIVATVMLGVACKSIMGDSSTGTANIYPSGPYIAKVSVEGAISAQGGTDYFGTPIGYQHQWTLDTIDELMEDDNNTGLILFVNSPGGGVYESDELYFKIKEYKEVTGRPVYSAMGSMAASGGYYISAPCDKIFANRNCWTGSIGVTMGTMFDFSEFFQRYGIKTNTVTSGANKAMGSVTEPMSEEQKQIFQSIVDEAYEQFVGIVAEGRKMDINKVKQIADGRIYTAKQALQLGLIDEIGTFDDATADMQEKYDLWDSEIADISFEEMSVFGSLFGKVNPSGLGLKGEAAAILELVGKTNQEPISYMSDILK
ncbi:MAG: signal peptide peptidase SppA [Aminipila sp.]